MAMVICKVCETEFYVVPARLETARCCSNACAGKWRSQHQRGVNAANWRGGKDRRKCQECGDVFEVTPASTKKFCSLACSRMGQRYIRGADHPLYKPDARRRRRNGSHASWARKVISRDMARCQHCGATEGELHAHHIKPYESHPELRFDVDNGLTLCAPCHWRVHAASNANGVNSGDILPGNAGDNPEPSFGRKPVEGVTTRGRAYRRWRGECSYCGTFISKRWSDVKGKEQSFCSRRCAGKWRWEFGNAFGDRPRQ